MPIRNEIEILDVGCGAGWFWRYAKDKLPENLKLTLTDISRGMVEEAQKNVEAANHYASIVNKVANATDIPFNDNTFDCVVAMHVLYHVSSPEKAIDEMLRVLKPGGLIAITTNDDENMKELFEISSSFFGGSSTDPAAAAFNICNAEKSVEKSLDLVTSHVFKDIYAITDPEDLINYITSFPPGIEADDEQIKELRDFVTSRMNQNSNVLNVNRVSALVCAR